MQPHSWTKEEIAALKSVYATVPGRELIDMIVFDLCRLGASSLSSDVVVMASSEGARFVGQELFNALHLPTDKIVNEGAYEPRHRTLTGTERANIHHAAVNAKRARTR